MGSNQTKQRKTLNGVENYAVTEKKQNKLKARFTALKTGSLRRDYNYQPQKGYDFPVEDTKYSGRRWHSSASLDAYAGDFVLYGNLPVLSNIQNWTG